MINRILSDLNGFWRGVDPLDMPALFKATYCSDDHAALVHHIGPMDESALGRAKEEIVKMVDLADTPAKKEDLALQFIYLALMQAGERLPAAEHLFKS